MVDRLVLACDGGGAKTTLVFALESSQPGEYVAELEVGTTNQNRIGHDAAAILLRDSVHQMLDTYDPDATIGSAVFGLAGIDTITDQSDMYSKLWDLADVVVVENDTMLPLGSLPHATGVALVAGTGSNCFGRNAHGTVKRAGGNGYDYDEGGGAWIAHRALGIASKINDGRIKATKNSTFMPEIYDAAQTSVRAQCESGTIKASDLGVAAEFTVAEFSDLHRLLYRLDPAIKRQLHGDIVPRIFDIAETGNPEALGVIRDGAYELALHVEAVADSLDISELNLAVTGSLLVKRLVYQEALLQQLAERAVDVRAPDSLVIVERPLESAVLHAKGLLT